MKISPRDQIIIGVVVTVLAALAIFFVLILPRFGEISEADAELEAVEMEHMQANTLLQRRQDAKANAAETQVLLLDVSTRFPEAPELPALIIELQNVANDVEIDFIQLAPGEPDTHDDLKNITVLPVTVAITGNWEQYIDFMAELGKLRREVRVTNFQVTGVEPDIEVDTVGEGEEGGTTAPVVIEDEDLLYTIAARVDLEAYMLADELEIQGGQDEEGAPAAPAEGSQ